MKKLTTALVLWWSLLFGNIAKAQSDIKKQINNEIDEIFRAEYTLKNAHTEKHFICWKNDELLRIDLIDWWSTIRFWWIYEDDINEFFDWSERMLQKFKNMNYIKNSQIPKTYKKIEEDCFWKKYQIIVQEYDTCPM